MGPSKRLSVSVGEHQCSPPERTLTEDVGDQLEGSEAKPWWKCPACGAKWCGGLAWRHDDKTWDVDWKRQTNSGGRWKRREARRLRKLVS